MGQRLSLEGIRVVEFCHVVMGPTRGLVLAGLRYVGEKVEALVTRRIVHAA